MLCRIGCDKLLFIDFQHSSSLDSLAKKTSAVKKVKPLIPPEKKVKGKAAAEEEVFIVDAEDFETVDVAAEPVVEAVPVENAAPVENNTTEIEV